jgi:hypothetical protein
MAQDTTQTTPLRYLTTPEAAGYLRLKPNTLEKMRSSGRGPRFRGHGRNVVYAIEDLDAWSGERVRQSTSDPTSRKEDGIAADGAEETVPQGAGGESNG